MDMEKDKKITIDLRKVMVEKDIDVYTETDLSKPIGNIIHQQAGDIGLDEKARELYHNGFVEVDMQTAVMMKEIVAQGGILYYVQQAVVREIEKSFKQ